MMKYETVVKNLPNESNETWLVAFFFALNRIFIIKKLKRKCFKYKSHLF